MSWKKSAKKVLFPHPALVVLFSVISFGMLIYSALAFETADILSIVSYVLSFCALVLVSVRLPAIIRLLARFREQNPYYLRYRSDLQLRMNITLLSSLTMNAAYALFQFCLGLKHHSAWFYSMAGYYLLLAVMRLTLARCTAHHTPGENAELEWRRYRLCGVCLLAMTLTLAVFTLYFVFRIRVFPHHEITTIAMAAYTFTALTLAVIGAVRNRRSQSPAYAASKNISLSSAAVSMLTLENALLTAFGADSSESFRQIMLGLTGTAVILVVHGIALYMIINATRMLRQLQNQSIHS